MELYDLTVYQLSDLIKSKKLGVAELTKAIIDRIKKIDGNIGSYITVLEEDAIKQSEKIQEKINKGTAASCRYSNGFGR